MLENDDVFSALAHVQRRQLLVSLIGHESRSVPELSSTDRQMMNAHEGLLHQYLTGPLDIAGVDKPVVRMYHVHLPGLADDGFIDWEQDTHVVSQGPRFDDIQPLLELLDDHRETRSGTDTAISLRG